MTGLFGEDCTDFPAWLDPGCIVQNIGTDLGSGVTGLLQPVWIAVGIIGVLVVIILLIIGFAPNVKHVIPHLSFL